MVKVQKMDGCSSLEGQQIGIVGRFSTSVVCFMKIVFNSAVINDQATTRSHLGQVCGSSCWKFGAGVNLSLNFHFVFMLLQYISVFLDVASIISF